MSSYMPLLFNFQFLMENDAEYPPQNDSYRNFRVILLK